MWASLPRQSSQVLTSKRVVLKFSLPRPGSCGSAKLQLHASRCFTLGRHVTPSSAKRKLLGKRGVTCRQRRPQSDSGFGQSRLRLPHLRFLLEALVGCCLSQLFCHRLCRSSVERVGYLPLPQLPDSVFSPLTTAACCRLSQPRSQLKPSPQLRSPSCPVQLIPALGGRPLCAAAYQQPASLAQARVQ